MLRWLLMIGGLLHLALLPIGLMVPRLLNWTDELSRLRPFLQRLVWTYGAFILLANLGFGVMTLVGVDEIVKGSRLGTIFAGFVACYWLARLGVQYFYFDWSDFPQGTLHKVARYLLDLLFLYLVVVYGWAAFRGW